MPSAKPFTNPRSATTSAASVAKSELPAYSVNRSNKPKFQSPSLRDQIASMSTNQ